MEQINMADATSPAVNGNPPDLQRMNIQELRLLARSKWCPDTAQDIKDEVMRRLQLRHESMDEEAFEALTSLNYIYFLKYDIPQEARDEVQLFQQVQAMELSQEQAQRLGLPPVFQVRRPRWVPKVRVA